MNLLTIITLASLLFFCKKKENDSLMQSQTYTYLALGDSYTIGESVSENQRWPNLLTEAMYSDSIILKPTIIAKTGWTTDELLKGVSEATLSSSYDLVSLLIGVNNQYRGYTISQYEKELEELLSIAIQTASDNPQRVFMVSIPDYGVTPFANGNSLNALKIAEEIDRYNAKAQDICERLNILYIDITPISRTAKSNPALIASDGLHPSADMYQLWVDVIQKRLTQHLSEN